MPRLPDREDRALRRLLSFLGQAQIELLQAKEHAELFGYSAEVVAKIDVLKRAVGQVVKIAESQNRAMGRITNRDRHEEASL